MECLYINKINNDCWDARYATGIGIIIIIGDEMKKIIIMTAAAASAIFIFTGCDDFATSYQSIDSGEFRLLNIMFSPAEAAPGDSVTMTAVFAGRKKSVEDIDWRISFNVVIDNYGGETAVDSEPLSKYGRVLDTSFSPNTQTIAYRFKVPENVVRRSSSIPENWASMLPAYLRSALPKELTSLTKNEMVDLIEAHAANAAYTSNNNIFQGGEPEPSPLYSQGLVNFLPAMLQFFTVPIRITANLKNEGREHRMQSGHSVRYNNRFENIGLVPINNNPVIDSILVYKVKGSNITSFDNKSGRAYETIRHDKSDTLVIPVQSGYTYFLEVFSSPFDKTMTMDAALAGSQTFNTQEDHVSYWQFQMNKNESSGVSRGKQMDVDNMFGRLIPPSDKSIKNFTLWVTVKDEVFNERFRPRGSALAEIQGRFEYK